MILQKTHWEDYLHFWQKGFSTSPFQQKDVPNEKLASQPNYN